MINSVIIVWHKVLSVGISELYSIFLLSRDLSLFIEDLDHIQSAYSQN